MTSTDDGVVSISYTDLVAACSDNKSNINDLIDRAFSSNGLGIIAITDVPNLPEMRLKLLPLAHKLASLPPNQLQKVTVPASGYQVGWSHGREKLEGDKFDYSKGSFYANPLTEDLAQTMLDRRKEDGDSEALKWDESLGVVKTEEEVLALAKSCPAFFAPNVWPSEDIPELESAFKDVGELVHQVGIMLAKCCDSFVAANCPGYEPKLEKAIKYSKCCKARLLHYFPSDKDTDGNNNTNEKEDDTDYSTGCGWHNDHGSLTGLLPALYIDENGKIIDCPDPKAGLYIKSRNGKLVHAKLPANSLMFQTGETAQITTGGLLQATPHAVRGCKGGNISRETFAMFIEPEYHSKLELPVGRSLEDTQCIEAEKHLPCSVRTLRSRWKMGMNFGQFSDATFAAFH